MSSIVRPWTPLKDLSSSHPWRQELERWEQPSYNPEAHPFPMMLFKATKRPDGIVVVGGDSEALNRQCYRTVRSAGEMEEALKEGWRESPQEARAYFEGLEKAIADAAAHRHYEDRNMSDKAKAEAEKADEATALHVAEIPEQPKRRRGGRPRKVRTDPVPA